MHHGRNSSEQVRQIAERISLQRGALFSFSANWNLEHHLQILESVQHLTWRLFMFYWALMFLLVALVAGVFGFGGLAGTSAWIAQVLFVVGLIAFIISLVSSRTRHV